jgi:hypothetical protein
LASGYVIKIDSTKEGQFNIKQLIKNKIALKTFWSSCSFPKFEKKQKKKDSKEKGHLQCLQRELARGTLQTIQQYRLANHHHQTRGLKKTKSCHRPTRKKRSKSPQQKTTNTSPD